MNDKASVSKELNAKHAKKIGNVQIVVEGPRGGRASTLGYSSACNVQESIGVLGYTSQSYLSCFLLVIGKVDNFGHMAAERQVAFMQRVGNEKSNNYWEAELPASVDRSDIGKFIRTKYQDKKWASRYAPQPALSNMTGETSEVGGKDIPRRARKYSLEEDGFSEQPPPVPITTRSRGVSLDMMDEMLNLPPINGLTGAPSVKHKEDTKDLFSLLYASEAKQDRTIVPPSRWATFECDSLAAGTKKQVRAPKESKAPSKQGKASTKQESQSTAETSNGRNLQRGSQGNSTKTTAPQSQASQNEGPVPNSDAEEEAEAYAKRLVEYDWNSAARTTVMDDQSYYCEIEGNSWLSKEICSVLFVRTFHFARLGFYDDTDLCL
ncbi:ADP-ribosylation factor GTPase-activating protein [Datura stramonium]|uniref:ADP-ribosylation factor GTPase-activating protein n=1 Tax=Datura stramonium TaxID=4076 RepID=A0ABS8RSK3_DATST|nr:ADP-ribosylation factor GTPase-activating protein [Datura stramonium]